MPTQATTTCTHAWCDARLPGHDEHAASTYTPATKSGACRPNLTVGAGLVVIDGDREPLIFVHIDDQDEIDEDAYMTVDEAVDLVDALITAISHARDVELRD